MKAIIVAECGHTGVAECDTPPCSALMWCHRCDALSAMVDSVLDPETEAV